MTCDECKQLLYPDDPTVHLGRYHLCTCDYCDKPWQQRAGNQVMPVREIIHTDNSQQITARLNHLTNRVNEKRDRQQYQERDAH